MRNSAAAALLALVFALCPACSTYHDELARSQHAFEQNQHERALAILRGLEPDTSHLTPTERAHYAYLRGMTDYRVGDKTDAHHWLAVAKALDPESPGLLTSEWKGRLDEALTELNTQIQAGGLESLSNAKRRPEAAPSGRPAKPKASDDEDDEDAPKPQKRKPIDDDE
jgi:hypothetical protein